MSQVMLFSVYDKQAEAYLPLFPARARGEAVRSFSQAVNDAKHQFYANVGDYELWFIGTFDDVNGAISGSSQKVVTGLDVRRSEPTGPQQ